jgi:hypothetical protein
LRQPQRPVFADDVAGRSFFALRRLDELDCDAPLDGATILTAVLELVGEQFVMAAEGDEGGAFVGKLELDLLDLAGVFAAAVYVGFDGHLLKRRGLVTAQIIPRRDITASPRRSAGVRLEAASAPGVRR